MYRFIIRINLYVYELVWFIDRMIYNVIGYFFVEKELLLCVLLLDYIFCCLIVWGGIWLIMYWSIVFVVNFYLKFGVYMMKCLFEFLVYEIVNDWVYCWICEFDDLNDKIY